MVCWLWFSRKIDRPDFKCRLMSAHVGFPDVGPDIGFPKADVGSDVPDVGSDIGFPKADVGSDVEIAIYMSGPMSADIGSDIGSDIDPSGLCLSPLVERSPLL